MITRPVIPIFALFFGLRWLHRAAIRPTYLRVALGIIQTIRYRAGGTKPEIVDFPITVGTRVVAIGKRAKSGGSSLDKLVLMRARNAELVPIGRMPDSDKLADIVWRAVLSTAPIPPLSEMELAG